MAGRPQSFDRTAVVRSARDVFWRDGYEAASLSALEQATGLHRSSLYHAFGSKRGLFDAAVEDYLDDVVRPRLVPLHPQAAPTALRTYLAGLRDAILAGGRAGSGCLLISAAGAAIGADPAVAAVVAGYRAELRAAIGHGVEASLPGRDRGEQDRLAEVCTGLVVAAFALARVEPTAAAAQLDAALASLDVAAPTPV